MKPQRTLLATLLVILGSAAIALNYYLLLQPNDILPPGIGGLVALTAREMNWPFDVVYLVVNIPLFLIGYRFVGLRFFLLSLTGTVSISLFLDLFSQVHGIHNLLLATLAGGVINGAAIALVLQGGGSTGGMDIVGVVLARKYPRFSIGEFMFGINTLVILVSGVFLGVTSLAATLASVFLAGKAVDIVGGWWGRWRIVAGP